MSFKLLCEDHAIQASRRGDKEGIRVEALDAIDTTYLPGGFNRGPQRTDRRSWPGGFSEQVWDRLETESRLHELKGSKRIMLTSLCDASVGSGFLGSGELWPPRPKETHMKKSRQRRANVKAEQKVRLLRANRPG